MVIALLMINIYNIAMIINIYPSFRTLFFVARVVAMRVYKTVRIAQNLRVFMVLGPQVLDRGFILFTIKPRTSMLVGAFLCTLQQDDNTRYYTLFRVWRILGQLCHFHLDPWPHCHILLRWLFLSRHYCFWVVI